MKEIICPKCNTVITVNDSDYEEIVSQVRTKEFNKELEERKKSIEDEKNNALKAISIEKDAEINRLKVELKDFIEAQNDKIQIAKNEISQTKDNDIFELKQEILKLQNQLNTIKKEEESKYTTLVAEKENVITNLKNEIAINEKNFEIQQKELKENHLRTIKDKDEQIAYYKDLKARLSVKLIGETLEQHCLNSFNQFRTSLFPLAYFDKDNKVSSESRSKGDFIFKDYGSQDEKDHDLPYISIMFEMKNEDDTTSTKKKNEHFFAELDKDRREKNCEYAVLVSLLEPDNDLYNAGIVDVSYNYPKMYVIRPQNFISMITLLSNASKNAISLRRELEIVKNQNLDIEHFEENLYNFKTAFGKNVDLAKRQFEDAIKQIDNSITALQKTRDNLMASQRNLRLANDKAQDLTIKQLTKESPLLKAKFDAIEVEENK